MSHIKIKASSITNLTDARYFAAKEVEWLGYCFDPASPHFVEPHAMQAIREWVGGVLTLGEFGFISGDELLDAAAACQLDAVQVGVFAAAQELEPLQGRVQVLREIVIQPGGDAAGLKKEIARLAHLTEATILAFRPNHITWDAIKAGRPFGVEAIRAICDSAPVLIDIDLDASMAAELVEALQPYGLVLHGGAEEKTGFKSFDDLDEIFEALQM